MIQLCRLQTTYSLDQNALSWFESYIYDAASMLYSIHISYVICHVQVASRIRPSADSFLAVPRWSCVYDWIVWAIIKCLCRWHTDSWVVSSQRHTLPAAWCCQLHKGCSRLDSLTISSWMQQRQKSCGAHECANSINCQQAQRQSEMSQSVWFASRCMQTHVTKTAHGRSLLRIQHSQRSCGIWQVLYHAVWWGYDQLPSLQSHYWSTMSIGRHPDV